MAQVILATNLTSGSAGSGSSANTASISPGGNKLIIINVGSSCSSTPNQPTISGCGLTLVAIQTKVRGTTYRFTSFRGLVPNPTLGTLTIDFAGQSQNDVFWTVDQISNIDTSGTNGSGAIVQSAIEDDSGSGAPSITLPAFSNIQNGTYGAIFVSGSTSITKGASFTELSSLVSTRLIESQFANSNQTTVNWTVNTGFFENFPFAAEIKAGQVFQGGMI